MQPKNFSGKILFSLTLYLYFFPAYANENVQDLETVPIGTILTDSDRNISYEVLEFFPAETSRNAGTNNSFYVVKPLNAAENSALEEDAQKIVINSNKIDGFTLKFKDQVKKTSQAEHQKAELAKVGIDKYIDHDYKPCRIRHIVLFRYLPTINTKQKSEVIKRFLALQHSKRNGALYIVEPIETGNNISGEGLNKEMEQGFIVTFQSRGDRNYFVGAPVVVDENHYDKAHQKFKEFIGPLLVKEGLIVFDFAIETHFSILAELKKLLKKVKP